MVVVKETATTSRHTRSAVHLVLDPLLGWSNHVEVTGEAGVSYNLKQIISTIQIDTVISLPDRNQFGFMETE